jgi:hypothetical protein
MLKERIKTFVALGNKIQQFLEAENPEKINPELADLLHRHKHYNPWFTAESIEFAMANLLPMLEKKMLASFCEQYPISEQYTEKKIALVAAGNIPFVEFHDFLCVLLSGHDYHAKLSSKNNMLMPIIKKMIEEINPEMAKHIHFLEDSTFFKNIDAIIATGSDNSARYFEYYFGKYPNIIRKNRNSIAVLDGNESHAEFTDLANDIFLYFGLGCRSVSKLYIPEKMNPEILIPAFTDFSNFMEHNAYMNNYTYNKAIFQMNNEDYYDGAFFLMKENPTLSSPLSVINFSYYENLADVQREIAVLSDKIQVVVSNIEEIIDSLPLGTAQEPQIDDFADGVDTMQFLNEL